MNSAEVLNNFRTRQILQEANEGGFKYAAIDKRKETRIYLFKEKPALSYEEKLDGVKEFETNSAEVQKSIMNLLKMNSDTKPVLSIENGVAEISLKPDNKAFRENA